MTSSSSGSRRKAGGAPSRASKAGRTSWAFQDAKARLSEVVRLARSDGPQLVTVHGRNAVVIVAEEEFRRLKGEGTGAALVAAMQASPDRDVEIEPSRARLPVRKVRLS